jgi:hypothetical protein
MRGEERLLRNLYWSGQSIPKSTSDALIASVLVNYFGTTYGTEGVALAAWVLGVSKSSVYRRSCDYSVFCFKYSHVGSPLFVETIRHHVSNMVAS